MTADRAIKEPCRVATDANISLSGLQTIDGEALAAADRVLVKAQTSAVNNGVWEAASGAWQRASDFDGAGEVVGGTEVGVTSGTRNGGTAWCVSGAGAIVIGTDPIDFEPAFATFIAAGADAATRTMVAKVRDLGISALDYYLPEHGNDLAPAINQALLVANGREVWLPESDQPIPCLSPIVYTTSNDAPAAQLKGASRERTILEFDYDSDDLEDAALQIDGSGVAYRYQYNGGLFDFTMRPKAGRRIAYGLSMRAWLYGHLQGLSITDFMSDDGTFGAGIINPYDEGLGNVDRYNVTSLTAVKCEVAECYVGVDLQTGLGAAAASFEKCRIMHNESDGVRYSSAANIAFPETALCWNGRRFIPFTANTTQGSAVLTVTSGAMPADFVKGKEIRGPGIPNNSAIYSVDHGAGTILLCAVSRQSLPGTPTSALATATQSNASFIMVGGYGFNMQGLYLGTSGGIDLSAIEFDGNASGAAYLKAFLSVIADSPRVISRNLKGINRVSGQFEDLERSPRHFVIDETYLGKRLRIRNAYHRFDVLLTEQNERAYHSATTLYEGGTGSVLNTLGMEVDIGMLLKGSTFTATTVNANTVITVTDDGGVGFEVGQEVQGSGIPANTTITNVSGSSLTLSAAATASASVTLTLTVPIKFGTGVFTDPAHRGRIVRDDYLPLSVKREHFYQRGQSSQSLTTSAAAILWTPQSANFADTAPSATSNGKVVADFTGDMRVSVTGVVDGASSGDLYTLAIRKNGSASSVFTQTVPTMGAAGKWAIRWDADVGVAPGDEVDATIQSSVARSLSTPLRIRFEAV